MYCNNTRKYYPLTITDYPYVLSPSGVRSNFYHPESTLSYNTIWGGGSAGEPGTWAFVLTNPTRYPIRVMQATYLVYLR